MLFPFFHLKKTNKHFAVFVPGFTFQTCYAKVLRSQSRFHIKRRKILLFIHQDMFAASLKLTSLFFFLTCTQSYFQIDQFFMQ